MATYSGVVAFDPRGLVKSWQQVDQINRHNNRLDPLAHCIPGADKPIRYIGTGDLKADIRAKMMEHGVNPDSIRKNGVIGGEVILSASRGYFYGEDGKLVWERLGEWLIRTLKAALAMWGKHRICSAVMHLDEHTPHLHLFILPLFRRVNQRRPSEGETWTLDARVISGPGEYQRAHDVYAEWMGPLGIERGERGSGRKNRPYSDELDDLKDRKEELATAIQAADEAKARYERLQEEERARWAEAFAKQSQFMADLKTAKVKMSEALRKAADERSAAAEETAAARKTVESLRRTIARATAFRRALEFIPLDELPTNVMEALQLSGDLQRAAKLEKLPTARDDSDEDVNFADLLLAVRSRGGRG